jgi:hypothetical protein
MHPDTCCQFSLRIFFWARLKKFLCGKFFLLFIFFRVAFCFSILAIGIQKESDRAGSLALPNSRLKSDLWQA